jgi:hypothetical protein
VLAAPYEVFAGVLIEVTGALVKVADVSDTGAMPLVVAPYEA